MKSSWKSYCLEAHPFQDEESRRDFCQSKIDDKKLSHENLISQAMNSIFFSSDLTLSMLYPDN